MLYLCVHKIGKSPQEKEEMRYTLDKQSCASDHTMPSPSWQDMWEGPEDPMEYIKVIVHKASKVHESWFGRVTSGSSLGQHELNLSDLFHPETFLGALRQSTARNHKVNFFLEAILLVVPKNS